MAKIQPSDDRRKAAVDFLQSVVAGKIEDAYRKHVDANGIHHNPFFPAGMDALMKAMMENHAQFPRKKITVKNVVADGDLVAVHSHLVPKSGDAGMIVVHIFRFKGNKIVELWDCGEVIPSDSPNRDGAF